MRKKRHLQPQQDPVPEGPHFSRSGTPHKGRKDDSVERSLAMVCEAHQKALAMVATLEEIERLSHTWNCSELRVRSKSRDHRGRSRKEQKRRCHQVWFEDQPALSCLADPKQDLASRGPMVKALICRTCQNWSQWQPPSWEGCQRPLKMKVRRCLQSLWSWSSASGSHGRLWDVRPWNGRPSCQQYQG